MSGSVVAILGHPVAHSLSPRMHRAAFQALGLDWHYVPLDVAPGRLPRAWDGALALGLRGWNVTAPHKREAASLADRLAGAAERTGSVNTVVVEADEVVGYSTDGDGLLRAADDLGLSTGSGARVAVVGAGGAALAVAAALAGRGAKVALGNRSSERLNRAQAEWRGGAGVDWLDWSGLAQRLPDADWLVYALPPTAPVPAELIGRAPPGAQAIDLSYAPAVTPFMRAFGHQRSHNGLGMLLHQGALALELWTGAAAPLGPMAEAIGYDLGCQA